VDAIEEARSNAREAYLAIRFLRRADPNRYGAMVADMENDYTRGYTGYPTTLVKAYDILINYVNPNRNSGHDDSQGMAFYQGADAEGNRGYHGGRGRGSGRGRGNGSGRGGNESNAGRVQSAPTDNANNAPVAPANANNEPVAPYLSPAPHEHLTHRAEIFSQRFGSIPKTWLLADSCSSVDIISSGDLLHDIHDADQPLELHCNAGVVTLTKKGYLGQYPAAVWYYPNGIANILSLRNLTKHYRITMDSKKCDGLQLHRPDGGYYNFTPSDNGLYRLPLNSLRQAQEMWSFVTTVADQSKLYTNRQIDAARRARSMQNIIMHPSDQRLAKTAIKYLANCPVTEHDIRTAADIFGNNVESLKGKTVRRSSPHVAASVDPVPPNILARHHHVTLAVDIMFVNRVPFLITLSRNLRFLTVENLPNRKENTVRDKLLSVLRLYRHRGFHVATVLADPEFEMLRPYIPTLNTCAADEHVPDIERAIRSMKDRVRSTHSRLPFKYLPRLIVVRLVANAVLWMNALPQPLGVLTDHSPRYLLLGRDLTYDKHVRLPFGSYVQTHEEHTNDMRHRTLGAICLGPSGNAQGGHFFFNLTSGSRILRHRWTALPMPDDVIRRVNQIGRQQGMPSNLAFANRHGNEILDRLQDIDPHLDPYASSDDDTYSSHGTSTCEMELMCPGSIVSQRPFISTITTLLVWSHPN
jgi:hypothetical protein